MHWRILMSIENMVQRFNTPLVYVDEIEGNSKTCLHTEKIS